MVHLHAEGNANWQLSDDVVDYLKQHLKPGMRTLETGAGLSTVTFAACGALHTAVTPAQAEVSAIKQEMQRRGVSDEHCQFLVGYSQDILPQQSGELDLALIDGGHGFPIPQVDWTYIAPRLKVGGILIVDDVDLWTGKILVDFMREEPGWEHLETLRGRTAIFRLTAPCELKEWCDQPFVKSRSRWPQLRRKLFNALKILFSGDFATLRKKLAHDRELRDAD